MKLKYKKIILLITMSTMAIGMVTLSIGSSSNKNPASVEQEKQNDKQAQDVMTQTGQSNIDKVADNTAAEGGTEGDSPIAPPIQSPEPNKSGSNSDTLTTSNTDAALVLKRDAYTEVNELIKKYLDARIANDLDAIKGLVNDSSGITLESLQKSSKYIEEYKTIECYTVDSPEPGAYVVYVYEEIKILGVDTIAPGMGLFYVSTDANGKPYIFFGEIADDIQKFIDETRDMEEVKNLINTVNKKLDEAKTQDEELGEFQKNIEKQATDTEN